MLKILVVDDEEIIRKGLAKSIKRLTAYEIVGEAADGKEAVSIIEASKPDVVITDIKMPRMDGRELVRYLEVNHPEIKKVVLSGFEDFSYVRDTMKNGAADYLLKPIDDEKLIFILQEIEANIQAESKSREDELSMKVKLNESLPLLKEQFISELLTTNKYSEEEILKKFNYYNIKGFEGKLNTLIISIDNFKFQNKEIGTEEIKLKNFILRNIAEETVSQTSGFFSCSTEAGIALVVFLKDEQNILKIAENINNNIIRFANERFSIGIGTEAYKLSDSKKSYEDGLKSLQMRFYKECVNVFFKSFRFTTDDEELQALFEKAAANLKSSVELIKPEEVRMIFNELFSAITKLKFYPSDVRKMIATLYTKLQVSFSDFERAVAELYGFEYSYSKDVDMFDTLEELINYSVRTYTEIIHKISVIRNKKDKKIVEVVKDYVAKHYREDISLARIAEIAYVNPNYFCDMFKSQTGENFIDYLTKVRIEKAKVLLKDIKIKTYEVGEMVGYEDPTYFSKVFKKAVGITPTQYRNLVT